MDDLSDKVRKKKQFWQFFHKKTKSQILVFNWWYFRIEWPKADLDVFIKSISPTDSEKKQILCIEFDHLQVQHIFSELEANKALGSDNLLSDLSSYAI